jgi:hypothetical protein
MTTTRNLQAVALAFVFLSFAVPCVSAQVTTAPTIIIKQPKPKYDYFRGQVVNFTPKIVTVREPKNVYNTRTFDFTPELAGKLENRHMEPGTKITVKFLRGSSTAVRLKGKIVRTQ